MTLKFLHKVLAPPGVLMAFKLVFFVQLARLASRSSVHALRVGWPAPNLSEAGRSAYADRFGAPVEDLRVPTVVFATEDVRRPFLTANHGMWKFFEPALRQWLADLGSHASERLRSALLEALPAGELSMQAVCKKLGLSTRTLQRRLQVEGSIFQQILDALRNSWAQHDLRSSSMSGAFEGRFQAWYHR
ncbi:helix-turn-helix transcriptional regulator [Variovorax sp. E3]|uniref:helix-turn-helix transcriptional regulator n=1 Tax=Variovorax sp. E3 TaxID=1914993 RepID=UPI0018DBCB1F|nr:helix-turn-helix transcriptional regulator [Variovorax sp. E3]